MSGEFDSHTILLMSTDCLEHLPHCRGAPGPRCTRMRALTPAASLAPDPVQVDSTAYDMLHRAHLEWPCLTFGIAKDSLGDARTAFPHTAYFVAGTQADRPYANRILCLKFSHMCKTKHDDESDPESDVSPGRSAGSKNASSIDALLALPCRSLLCIRREARLSARPTATLRSHSLNPFLKIVPPFNRMRMTRKMIHSWRASRLHTPGP